jgi:hypothetical protein
MESSAGSRLRQEDLSKFRAGGDIRLAQTGPAAPSTAKPIAKSSSSSLVPPPKRRKIEETRAEAAQDPALLAHAANLFKAPFVSPAPTSSQSSLPIHAPKIRIGSVDADDIEVDEDASTADSNAVDRIQSQHKPKFLSVKEIAAAERDGTGASSLMPHFSVPAFRVSAYSLALICEIWDVTKIDGVDPHSGDPQWALIPKPAFNPPAQKANRLPLANVNSAFDSLYTSSIKVRLAFHCISTAKADISQQARASSPATQGDSSNPPEQLRESDAPQVEKKRQIAVFTQEVRIFHADFCH